MFVQIFFFVNFEVHKSQLNPLSSATCFFMYISNEASYLNVLPQILHLKSFSEVFHGASDVIVNSTNTGTFYSTIHTLTTFFANSVQFVYQHSPPCEYLLHVAYMKTCQRRFCSKMDNFVQDDHHLFGLQCYPRVSSPPY